MLKLTNMHGQGYARQGEAPEGVETTEHVWVAIAHIVTVEAVTLPQTTGGRLESGSRVRTHSGDIFYVCEAAAFISRHVG